MVGSNMNFESLERQDEFVYHVLAKHLEGPGFFLDVGCASPKGANNTYALENDLGWNGIAFDVGDVEVDENWSSIRKTPFVQVDATSEQFAQVLKNNVNAVVDYISLDVDAGGYYQVQDSFTGLVKTIEGLNLSHLVLPRILEAGVVFKCMTLEHEAFKWDTVVTFPTRSALEDLGYKMLFEDVCFEDGSAWEDWWINPEFIPVENIMSIATKGETYHECLDKLITFTE